MKEFIKVMKALRGTNRVKILKMLQHGELCVCEIQKALEISQPTASKHLKILEEANFLNSRKKGLWVYYRLNHGSGSPYAVAMLGNLKHWLDETPEITEIVKRLHDLRRATHAAHNSQDLPVNLKNQNGR